MLNLYAKGNRHVVGLSIIMNYVSNFDSILTKYGHENSQKRKPIPSKMNSVYQMFLIRKQPCLKSTGHHFFYVVNCLYLLRLEFKLVSLNHLTFLKHIRMNAHLGR